MKVKEIKNNAMYMGEVFDRYLTVVLENGKEIVLFDYNIDEMKQYGVGDVIDGDIFAFGEVISHPTVQLEKNIIKIDFKHCCYIPFENETPYKVNSQLGEIYVCFSEGTSEVYQSISQEAYYKFSRLFLTFKYKKIKQGLKLHNSVYQVATSLSPIDNKCKVVTVDVQTKSNHTLNLTYTHEKYIVYFQEQYTSIDKNDKLNPLLLNLKMLHNLIELNCNNHDLSQNKKISDIKVTIIEDGISRLIYLGSKEIRIMLDAILEVYNESLL